MLPPTTTGAANYKSHAQDFKSLLSECTTSVHKMHAKPQYTIPTSPTGLASATAVLCYIYLTANYFAVSMRQMQWEVRKSNQEGDKQGHIEICMQACWGLACRFSTLTSSLAARLARTLYRSRDIIQGGLQVGLPANAFGNERVKLACHLERQRVVAQAQQWQ